MKKTINYYDKDIYENSLKELNIEKEFAKNSNNKYYYLVILKSEIETIADLKAIEEFEKNNKIKLH